MSDFSIFHTGLRSLQAHQQALNTTAHNIANANTPGYSRQRAELSAHYPLPQPSLAQSGRAGMMGTGVHVTAISQMRDFFLDDQMRTELSQKGVWDGEQEILNRIEAFLNEPSDQGLAATLAEFFDSLEKLSLNPESSATRQLVIENGSMLTEVFNRGSSNLQEYQKDLNFSIEARVTEVNSLAEQIADLNAQIVRARGSGDNPNDLLDRRQLLTEELSEIVGTRVHRDNLGNMNITVGGMHLVEGSSYRSLEAYEDETNQGLYNVRWSHSEAPVTLNGGQLEALLRGRDEYIGGILNSLDELAGNLQEEFNAIHQQGFGLDGSTGLDFFSGEGAAGIRVNEDIAENRAALAASGTYVRDIIDGDEDQGLFVAALDREVELEFEEGADLSISVDENRVTVTLPSGGATYEQVAALINDHEEAGQLLQISFTPGQEEEVLDIEEEFTDLTYPAGVPAGNSDNVRALLDLREERIMDGGNATMEEYFRALTAEVGVLGQKAQRMGSNQDNLLRNIEQRREEVSGVSLDEEMANMIRFQHAYSAASTLINRADQMMESLLGMVR